MQISIYPDTNTLSHEAAQFIVRLANEAIITRGRFTIALSGGSTPKVLYSLLGDEPYRSQIDWAQVDIFWSDERCVPPDSEESNYHLAQQVLLSKILIPDSQVHRMPADRPDRDAASQAYTEEMYRTFGTNRIPKFDLMHLGMGPEGHTCSLFPHQESLHEQQRLDRKSTRLNSSHANISYAVFCLQKKKMHRQAGHRPTGPSGALRRAGPTGCDPFATARRPPRQAAHHVALHRP